MVVNMAPGQPGQTNVLVVEDEMVLRMRAVDIVEDAGFTAVQAVNADEAIRILEGRSGIALLFSDIQMPGSKKLVRVAGASSCTLWYSPHKCPKNREASW